LRESPSVLSLYFKTRRTRYYDLLQARPTEGVWEEWIEFLLEGTETTARQQPTQPFFKFVISSNLTGKRFERW